MQSLSVDTVFVLHSLWPFACTAFCFKHMNQHSCALLAAQYTVTTRWHSILTDIDSVSHSHTMRLACFEGVIRFVASSPMSVATC